jgi:hypothetical protein
MSARNAIAVSLAAFLLIFMLIVLNHEAEMYRANHPNSKGLFKRTGHENNHEIVKLQSLTNWADWVEDNIHTKGVEKIETLNDKVSDWVSTKVNNVMERLGIDEKLNEEDDVSDDDEEELVTNEEEAIFGNQGQGEDEEENEKPFVLSGGKNWGELMDKGGEKEAAEPEWRAEESMGKNVKVVETTIRQKSKKRKRSSPPSPQHASSHAKNGGGGLRGREEGATKTMGGGLSSAEEREERGKLVCNGKETESEVIYWKRVPGDISYESPITPHHANHHDAYLTFEYDQGGWNNVRMSLECIIVAAHAMGRTLVIPPQQHLYLLGAKHQDKGVDEKAHDEMGFEDFFDIDLLRKHQGLHVMEMDEFLAKEGQTGGLHGVLPPHNSSDSWGPKLWGYLDKVSDLSPQWMGHFMAFPSAKMNDDWRLEKHKDSHLRQRLKAFGADRLSNNRIVYYDKKLQNLHHIHIPGDSVHRVLQHHYAFAFFADPEQQSFYKRFVRDFMRYRDNIQCAGAELVAAVRKDALKSDPERGGEYYAMHIRRGDLQYKNVKISAEEIVRNLNVTLPPEKGGGLLIPRGALVYLSTDDPDGKCRGCRVGGKPCETYPSGSKPVGCPEDPSWDAMKRAGWQIRLLRDYQKAGVVADNNPNHFGMIESIVCSRAKAFAGTYFSTFTGTHFVFSLSFFFLFFPPWFISFPTPP